MNSVKSLVETLESITNLCKEVIEDSESESEVTAGNAPCFMIGECKEINDPFICPLREEYQISFDKIHRCLMAKRFPENRQNQVIESVYQYYNRSFLGMVKTSEVNQECTEDDLFKKSSNIMLDTSSSTVSPNTVESTKRCKSKLPKEARNILERVFERKKSLNSRERLAIAKWCGLSPKQVRVWFINKRMRSK